MNEELQEKLELTMDEAGLAASPSQVQSMNEKYEEALQTIEQLRNDIAAQKQQRDGLHDDSSVSKSVRDHLKQLEEENLELREVNDHLSNENDAAKEIKSIVLELRAKNVELNASLRASRDQKRAAAEIIERLKADNESLRADIANLQSTVLIQNVEGSEDRVVPYERGADGLRGEGNAETELQHYKMVVSQLMNDRNVFSERLAELMAISQPLVPLKRRRSLDGSSDASIKLPYSASATLENLLEASRSDVPMIKAEALSADYSKGLLPTPDVEDPNCYALTTTNNLPDVEQVQEQLRTLTIENGQLAQRLGVSSAYLSLPFFASDYIIYTHFVSF